jgi:hypothetical protein
MIREKKIMVVKSRVEERRGRKEREKKREF